MQDTAQVHTQAERWCVRCNKNIPAAEFIEHDVQEHNGLWRARDFHRWVCEFEQAGSCTCKILLYEESAERLSVKCVEPSF